MRQLCNVTYAAIVEGMTSDERKDFDRKLNQPRGGPRPGQAIMDPQVISLMQAMQMRQAGG